jgi:transcriptional regulator with XRE-family HTH domain
VVETFGQALRRLRGSMSIRELAGQAHCGKTHVSDLERGRRAPSPRTAAALDRALGAGGQLAALVPAPATRRAVLAVAATGATTTNARRTGRESAGLEAFPRVGRPASGEDLLADLRAAVAAPPAWPGDHEPTSDLLATLAGTAHRCHDRYQAADYTGAAELAAMTVRQIEALAADPPVGLDRRALYRTQAVLYLAAAKLATRTGDHDLAWITADRGQHAALAADTPALVAAIRRQIACVFYDTGRLTDADQVIAAALDTLLRVGIHDDPDVISACGALHLLGAMTSTRLGEQAQALRQFAAAANQAHALGREDNRLWTAFGPTNVAIHALGAAITLDEPTQAVHVAERIDTRLLPAPLIGRRVRVQIDLARAHTSLGEDATATVHILDVAHRAPQMLRYDTAARTVFTTLLGRARGSTVSVLCAAADQVGIAA